MIYPSCIGVTLQVLAASCDACHKAFEPIWQKFPEHITAARVSGEWDIHAEYRLETSATWENLRIKLYEAGWEFRQFGMSQMTFCPNCKERPWEKVKPEDRLQ